MLDDAVPVRRIGELEAENLGVLLRLLEAVARACVDGLRLHDRNRKIAPVPEEVVHAFLRSPFHLGAGDHNAAVSEALLFAYLFVGPARRVELGQDVPTTGIRFGEESHFCVEYR